MKWIEMITLRSGGDIQDFVINELFKPVTKGYEEVGLTSMKIYRNAWIETDVSVHLHWRSAPAELRGSTMGLRLAQTLKEFGLVNHSAWVEERK